MAEFLLELFSEEIPARFQRQAADDLRRLFSEGLTAQGLAFGEIKAFATPRRLVLVVEGLPVERAAREEERKGPKVGAPEAAINGFLKSAGVESLAECKQIETPKGNFWIAVSKIPVLKTEEILPGILWDALQKFPWKKSQNWAEGSFQWVRPLRSIIAIFDGRVLPYYVHIGDGSKGAPASMHHIDKLAGMTGAEKKSCIKISNTTRGHRFMSAGEITVDSYRDYAQKLLAAHVMIDGQDRQGKIKADAEKILLPVNGRFKDDPALLEEVAGLTEWPVPLLGKIEEEFMEIPSEVLITTMRNNQKYFSAIDDSGKMLPLFVITANLETKDRGSAVIAGNERVLRARFSDAKFFWDLDRKTTLESRLPQLSSITFHAKLGSMAEKVGRLEALSMGISKILSERDRAFAREADIKKASRIAKADLVSGMVGEFPELQGIMGGYYARHDGENADVARAVREHYSPLGPGDTCPSMPVSVVVAMADKIDALVGFFSIDEKPTGSKDPYALRRAALGVLRLIVENGLRFDIRDVLKLSYDCYGQYSEDAHKGFLPENRIVDDLCLFFADRLKAMLREKNVRHDIIDAVFTPKNIVDIAGQMAKLEALQETLVTEEGQAVLALYNRAANILKIEEKKDKKSYGGAVNKALLVETEEKELQETLSVLLPSMKDALASDNYKEAMHVLVSLRSPLYTFFDKTTINTELQDIRTNRLTLLGQLRDAIHEIADFSVLEGSK